MIDAEAYQSARRSDPRQAKDCSKSRLVEHGCEPRSRAMETDRPIEFHVESFCEKCEKCARECPLNAIPKGRGQKMKTRGVTKWQVDAHKCASYWTLHNRYNFPNAHDACAKCIYICPWTKYNAEEWPHRLVVAAVTNFPWFQKIAIKGDDIAGYGKPYKTDPSWEKWF